MSEILNALDTSEDGSLNSEEFLKGLEKQSVKTELYNNLDAILDTEEMKQSFGGLLDASIKQSYDNLNTVGGDSNDYAFTDLIENLSKDTTTNFEQYSQEQLNFIMLTSLYLKVNKGKQGTYEEVQTFLGDEEKREAFINKAKLKGGDASFKLSDQETVDGGETKSDTVVEKNETTTTTTEEIIVSDEESKSSDSEENSPEENTSKTIPEEVDPTLDRNQQKEEVIKLKNEAKDIKDKLSKAEKKVGMYQSIIFDYPEDQRPEGTQEAFDVATNAKETIQRELETNLEQQQQLLQSLYGVDDTSTSQEKSEKVHDLEKQKEEKANEMNMVHDQLQRFHDIAGVEETQDDDPSDIIKSLQGQKTSLENELGIIDDTLAYINGEETVIEQPTADKTTETNDEYEKTQSPEQLARLRNSFENNQSVRDNFHLFEHQVEEGYLNLFTQPEHQQNAQAVGEILNAQDFFDGIHIFKGRSVLDNTLTPEEKQSILQSTKAAIQTMKTTADERQNNESVDKDSKDFIGLMSSSVVEHPLGKETITSMNTQELWGKTIENEEIGQHNSSFLESTATGSYKGEGLLDTSKYYDKLTDNSGEKTIEETRNMIDFALDSSYIFSFTDEFNGKERENLVLIPKKEIDELGYDHDKFIGHKEENVGPHTVDIYSFGDNVDETVKQKVAEGSMGLSLKYLVDGLDNEKTHFIDSSVYGSKKGGVASDRHQLGSLLSAVDTTTGYTRQSLDPSAQKMIERNQSLSDVKNKLKRTLSKEDYASFNETSLLLDEQEPDMIISGSFIQDNSPSQDKEAYAVDIQTGTGTSERQYFTKQQFNKLKNQLIPSEKEKTEQKNQLEASDAFGGIDQSEITKESAQKALGLDSKDLDTVTVSQENESDPYLFTTESSGVFSAQKDADSDIVTVSLAYPQKGSIKPNKTIELNTQKFQDVFGDITKRAEELGASYQSFLNFNTSETLIDEAFTLDDITEKANKKEETQLPPPL